MTDGPFRAPFRGCLTALPTPFNRGRIDFSALHGLVQRQIRAGVDGVVLAGSTGESAALSPDERLALCEFAVGAAGGRLAIIAGLGAGPTHDVCALARGAEGVGVQGLMLTTPAYSCPSARGLEAHFGAAAEASGLPVMLYNIPARTGVDLEPESVAAIANAHPNVVAIKESSSLDRLRTLLEALDLQVISGEDRWIIDAMELGCAGIVGVVSNLLPERVARLVHAFGPDGDPGGAPAEAEGVTALAAALALETNPAPLKAAMQRLGLVQGELRLPLVPLDDVQRSLVDDALRAVHLVD